MNITTITDHQGSLAACIDATSGGVTHMSYDAWGRRRNTDGTYGNVSATFDRGYTGHEHLDEFGLINMNGRLYDPILGRMLSPDIVVQQADYTQSYNRYSYCLNNPLRFVDPSGWVIGDFYWGRKYLGSDGIDDGKVYLLRDGEDSGLTRSDLRKAAKFIKENDGNTEAFEQNSVAYDTSIEIEGSKFNRQAMYDIVKKDDGTGGTSDCNNREYGGWIDDGEVFEAEPGPVVNPEFGNASIELPVGYPTFHSHPSGNHWYVSQGERHDFWHEQLPSKDDKDNAGGFVHYVFGRYNNVVYIYNRDGIQAILWTNTFVNLKK